MSFWVYLEDKNGKVVEVPEHTEGGTYVEGGSDLAELNVTYNYSSFYYKVLDKDKGLRWLDGKDAGKTMERIEEAIRRLGKRRSENYWESSPGNAGYALSILFKWIFFCPSAIWRVS